MHSELEEIRKRYVQGRDPNMLLPEGNADATGGIPRGAMVLGKTGRFAALLICVS